MQGTEVTPKSAALLRQRLVRFWRAKRVPLVGLLLALLALGSWIVWQFPSVLRTGNREPTPEGGEISGLATVCRGAVQAGYCARPALIAHELQVRPFEIIEGHVTATGATRPRRLLIRVRRADGSYVRYRAKWRQVPDSLEESNNSPRRELASYAIQRLLFQPERYVVVPTVLRCLPLTKLAALGEGSAFPGAQCVLGLMSHWLEDAREFDMGLIESANASFAQRIGDLNAVRVCDGAPRRHWRELSYARGAAAACVRRG